MKTKNFLVLALFFLSVLLLYRFLSWGFMMNTFKFLNSIKIPSFIAILLTIVALFTDIEKIKNLFQMKIFTIVMNKKLQNYLLIVLAASSLFLTFTNVYFTPPKWKKFINIEFLSGSQDDFRRANKTIEEFDLDKNSTEIFSKCIGIFKTRELISNNTSASIDLDMIKTTINALNRTNIDNNYIKAIIQFSLAEGNSILDKYDVANSYYDSFILNKKNVLTDKWISSVYMNKGNIEFYKGDYKLAIEAWNLIPKAPIILSNIAVAYTMLEEYNKGLDYINEGLNLIDNNYEQFPTVFNGLVANKIGIHIINDQLNDALEVYNTAKSLMPLDNELTPEVVLIYILSKKYDEARTSLDNFHNTNAISSFKYNLYYGLYFVSIDNHESSIKYFRDAFNLNQEESDLKYIYDRTKEHFVNEGYVNSSNIMKLIDKIKTLPNNI